ncbi:MAG: hypothetical protein KGN34_12670 [Sphingomonadales bacterium]|nr:hypothetical protein [Sphingomonadales bacterium]
MRRFFLTLAAATVLVPASAGLPLVAGTAFAKQPATYHGKAVVKRCRKSSGTTGLIAGGVVGAVAGGSVIGGGIAGPLIGAAGGALAGRAIDRTITAKKRCTYVSE